MYRGLDRIVVLPYELDVHFRPVDQAGVAAAAFAHVPHVVHDGRFRDLCGLQ
jgi:hypothetical protein